MLATLPEKYYLSHAWELFNHVSEHSKSLLSARHRQYLADFADLTKISQCLLVRMLARKPLFFNRGSLHYEELGKPDAALIELIQAGFVGRISSQDWPKLCTHLTKPLLKQCLLFSQFNVKSTSSKHELVRLATTRLTGNEPELREIKADWFCLRQQETLNYILFLFFGDLTNRLQKFVMRDMGKLQTHKSCNPPLARLTRELKLN